MVEEEGFAAMADCQYDWSTKTVPKLPTMLMTPKMIPPLEIMVSRPPRLSLTGPQDWPGLVMPAEVQSRSEEATAWRASYTLPGSRGALRPVYTSRMKVSRITKMIAVWM